MRSMKRKENIKRGKPKKMRMMTMKHQILAEHILVGKAEMMMTPIMMMCLET